MATQAPLDTARAELRATGRAAMGVSGDEVSESLARAVGTSRAGWYPLLALGALAVVGAFQLDAYTTLGPDISVTLGLGKSVVTALLIVDLLALVLASVPIAALVQRTRRRGMVAWATGVVWSVMTLCTGLVTSAGQLLVVLVADGASNGSLQAVHQPLLLDTYPARARVRVLSAYQAAVVGGTVLSPVLVAVLTGPADLTWRGVFVAMGIISLGGALLGTRLRDPGFGAEDSARLRAKVREASGATHNIAADLDDATRLRTGEIVQRLLLIPTYRRALAVASALGVGIVPLRSYFAFFLQERWGLDATHRAIFYAGAATCTAFALILGARFGERLYRRDPARLMRFGGALIAAAAIALVLAVIAPVFAMTAVFYCAAAAMLTGTLPALYTGTLSVVSPRMRSHANALLGVFLIAVGGVLGLIVLGSVDARYGVGGSVISVGVPCLIAAALLWSSARTVNTDLDRLVDEIVESEEVAAMDARGEHLPLLSCRNVNFSYDALQVLFDVDFNVDDGEVVALLGTNGAGKSTLLRVISGVGLPWTGSVRFRGADITYLDAERRVALGITQVPGGRAVFAQMSVVDNMRVFGFSHGRNHRAVDSGIDAALAAFPRLAERRNQLAGTLSGGEQQMLALSKAFILQPRVLCVDELSLGLAPRIVSELLGMVELINRSGTAVVLVEQSVNVALTLAHRAYFMEKGQVQFEGRAADLLGRDDLLRSVFLEGAARTMAGTR